MTYNYSPSSPYSVEVSSSSTRSIIFSIVGNVDVELTDVYTYDSMYIESVTKDLGNSGEWVRFTAVLKPYSADVSTNIAFDIYDLEGNSYRTTTADSFTILITEYEGYSYAPLPSISFDNDVIEVNAQSGHTYNNIYKNNIRSYTASTDADWVTILDDGRTSNTIEIGYQANEGEARTASIVFEALETTQRPFASTYIFYFTINQAASGAQPMDGTLSFERKDATIQSGGGFFDFAYTSENIVGYPTFTSDSSWIYTRDVDEGNVSVFIPVNNGEYRNGKLIANAVDTNGNELMASVNIYQLSDLYMPSIELSSDSITVGYSSGSNNEVSFTTTYCDHLSAYTDVDWITIMPRTTELGFNHIMFEYSANTYAQREGNIYLRNYGDDEVYTEVVLNVVQSEVPNWESLPRCEMVDTLQLTTWAVTSGTIAFQCYNYLVGRVIGLSDYPYTYAEVTSEGVLTYYVDMANDTDEERELKVGVEYYSSDGRDTYRKWVTLIQPKAPNVDFIPIWKDSEYVITDGSGPYKDYTLTTYNGIMHMGRVYGNPSSILLNGIFRAYIEEHFNPLETGIQDNGGYISATLSVNDVPKDLINMYNDWSYEERNTSILSCPIRHTMVRGQYVPQSFLGMGTSILSVNGAQFNINSGIYTHNIKSDSLRPITYSINGESYTITPIEVCAPYVFYYRNLYGGYDWFVFNKVERTDNFKRDTYNTNALNTTIAHRKRVYNNEKTETYVLTTDYLKDYEMELFAKHLASSNECYMYDTANGEVKPVNITTNSIKYNTFRANGRRYFTASINVEVSKEYLSKG